MSSFSMNTEPPPLCTTPPTLRPEVGEAIPEIVTPESVVHFEDIYKGKFDLPVQPPCSPVHTEAGGTIPEIVTPESVVHFEGTSKRKFDLPLRLCSSAIATRDLIAEDPAFRDEIYDFWIGKIFVISRMWTELVKPGSTVVLRPRYVHLPPLLPPSPPPKTPTSVDASTVEYLEISEMRRAEGYYKLSFPGCEDRIFRFMPKSTSTSLKCLKLYRRFIASVTPLRWADLHSNRAPSGKVAAVDYPQVNIGPVLADDLADLEDCTIALMLRGTLDKISREKDGMSHLNGDLVHMYALCPSWIHAQAALEEMLSHGYSLEGSWPRLDMSTVDKSKRGKFVGETIKDDEGHEFFFIAGAAEIPGSEQAVEQDAEQAVEQDVSNDNGDNESFEVVDAAGTE